MGNRIQNESIIDVFNPDFDLAAPGGTQGKDVDNAGGIHPFTFAGHPDFVLCIPGDFRYPGSRTGVQPEFVDDG